MKLCIYEEATGTIKSLLSSNISPDLLPVPEGHAILQVPEDLADTIGLTTHKVEDGATFVPQPADLTESKAALWADVKAMRTHVADGGCPTPLGVAQTDVDSRLKVSGAVQMALIAKAAGQPFTVSWVMKDNVGVDHDADQTVALGMTIGKHVNDAYDVSMALRAQIDAAETLASLSSINILAAPWPPCE